MPTLLTFIDLKIWRKVSICRRWFLFVVSYYVNFQFAEWSMDSNMVSKIWGGMATANIHLLQFKIQSHLQKRGLGMPVNRNLYQRISCLKFLTLHSPFYLFSHKNTLNKFPSWVFWGLFLLMKPSDALQDCSFKHKESKI